MSVTTERISKHLNEWLKNPWAPRTEERELEYTEAVLEFFGVPEFSRKEAAAEIRAKYAARNASQRA